jgi:hypothetical protein
MKIFTMTKFLTIILICQTLYACRSKQSNKLPNDKKNKKSTKQQVKMNDKIIIDGNTQVSIKSIKQRLTYDGLLEGLPTKEMNGRIMVGLKEDARKFCQLNEVYLIEPEQKTIEYNGRYPFGEPAQLPSVICIVELRSYSVFKDKTKDYSALGLIWFQDNFMFPIDSNILEKIKTLPFDKVCEELNY